ncbi:hypothetical protein HPB49_008346 [Dermacentor silvarum]|uniref:Uncharacterized protein n=1 Tax=Dermacentor silvarum TaxID=543639 RepID=A0ACB8D4B5_DERSI|nr:hypothetical protein HPB49_008346 [Dermacentor silvarum]
MMSYLTGKMAANIYGLPLGDQNYEIAVKTLVKRFGNDNAIIEKYLSKLLDIRPVHNIHDTEKLRTRYDEVQAGFQSLKAFGVASNSNGCC